jgi:hypothetical protein
MARNGYIVAPALLAVGLALAACGGSGESSTTTVTETVAEATTSTSAAPATSAAPTAAGGDLASLIPTPVDSQRTHGPDAIHDSGVHKHFQVTGAPMDVMDAYKTALEGAGWSVVVENSGGGGGGGGATYTGTNGDAYGVFVGGGYGSNTDVNSCAWPTKPSNTSCGDH